MKRTAIWLTAACCLACPAGAQSAEWETLTCTATGGIQRWVRTHLFSEPRGKVLVQDAEHPAKVTKDEISFCYPTTLRDPKAVGEVETAEVCAQFSRNDGRYVEKTHYKSGPWVGRTSQMQPTTCVEGISPSLSTEWGKCVTHRDEAEVIGACTAILQSGTGSDDARSIVHSKLAEAHTNRSRIQNKEENLARAVAEYDKAIELNPTKPGYHVDRGKVHNQRGEFDRAVADYTKALELSPKANYMNYDIYANRGIARSKMGDFGRAIDDYDAAVAIASKSWFVYSGRGVIFNMKGDFQRAIADFSKALELYPKDAIFKPHDVYFDRGYAYEMSGNKVAAISDYRTALSIEPRKDNAKDALQRLGETP